MSEAVIWFSDAGVGNDDQFFGRWKVSLIAATVVVVVLLGVVTRF